MPALREIFAIFGVEFDRNRELQRGARQVSEVTNRIRQLGAMLGGTLIVRGAARFVQSTLDMADELDKTAQQTGLTTAELQAFRHAAQLAGVEGGAFANALGQLQRRARDAAEGTEESLAAFRDAGIQFQDEAGNLLSGSQLLRNVAEGLSHVENSSLRTALAMELMGRQGRRMLPLFSGGAAGLEQLTSELDGLGGGFSQQFIDRSVEINDNMTRFRLALTSLRSTILLGILPTINRVVLALTRWASDSDRINRLLAIMRPLFIGIGTVAAAAAVRAAAAWGLALLPFLAAAAAVALLYLAIDDLKTAAEGGDSVLKRLGVTTEQAVAAWQTLRDIWEEARITWLNLQDALRGWAGHRAIERTDSGILGELGETSASYRMGESIRGFWGRVGLGGLVERAQLGGGRRMGEERAPGRGALAPATATTSLPGTVFEETRVRRAEPPSFYEYSSPRGATAAPSVRMEDRRQVTITVNEATDAAATARVVRAELEEHDARHARRLRAALVPGGSS